MTLILWGRASSVNVQKVLWALDELGLDYERRDAGGRYGVVDTPEFARLNPNRRVPVLQDKDLTLWESQAILRYLAGRENRLMPASLTERAMADQWLAFTDTTLQPPFVAMFWQMVRLPEEKRNEETRTAQQKLLEQTLRIIDGHLREHEWLSGGAFGIADIAAGALMHRITDLGLRPDGASGLDRWCTALMAGPAFGRHVAVSYEELRAR